MQKPVNKAVFIAHPGHELRIHHWMELNTPTVLVLTNGAGRTCQSRLPSTDRILAGAGATRGPIYGRYSDKHIYDRVLGQDEGFFLGLAQELADYLDGARIDMLVGDADEGYNTSHDLCRYLMDMAVERLRLRTGRSIAMYRFLLVGKPDECPAESRDRAIWVHLDELALQRKLTAAHGYPELAAEVEHVKQKFGFAPFMVECLQPLDGDAHENGTQAKPYYETHGEQQMKAGFYEHVIRYSEHITPIRAALAAWARSKAQ